MQKYVLHINNKQIIAFRLIITFFFPSPPKMTCETTNTGASKSQWKTPIISIRRRYTISFYIHSKLFEIEV